MADLIPRKILFGNPDRGSPEVAPDGRRLAHLAPVDDVLNVWVGNLDGNGARPVTSDTDRGIRSYRWAEDGRHLVYLQDSGGDENWRFHIVDPETGADRDATPFDGVQARVLGVSRRHPGHMLIGHHDRTVVRRLGIAATGCHRGGQPADQDQRGREGGGSRTAGPPLHRGGREHQQHPETDQDPAHRHP